jgi:hypothetical protein
MKQPPSGFYLYAPSLLLLIRRVDLSHLSHSSSPLLDHFSAWLTVDSKPLQVFNAHSEGMETVALVEAKEGASFEFNYGDLRQSYPKYSYMSSVYWNGQWCVLFLLVIAGAS